jgi:DsbC/DsbD-like thiol-disulfide interchange protein
VLTVAVGGFAAAVVGAASLAWACTPPSGGTVIPSRNSVGRGGTVRATATDVDPSIAGWKLYFNDPDDVGVVECHHAAVSSAGTASSNGAGNITTPLSITVPLSSGTGAAELCFAVPGHSDNISDPVNISIT